MKQHGSPGYFLLFAVPFTIAAAGLLAGCALKLGGTFQTDALADPAGDDARQDLFVEPTGDGQCPDGLTNCGGVCVDTQSDESNCGDCGNPCPETSTCLDGVCSCGPDLIDCGGECINPDVDRRHCGGCNNACDARANCVGGECECLGDLTDCGGTCVDTNTNNNHCGGCNIVCVTPQFCNGAGVCATICADSYTLCDPGPGAYCADLSIDPLNCGSCHNLCPTPLNSFATCAGGTCGSECLPGYVDVDGSPGCECSITGSETCDGRDNDCNGSTDEGFDCAQDSPPINCQDAATSCSGLNYCQVDCTWGTCTNPLWACTPGTTQGCGEGCGALQTCDSTCAWGACVPNCPAESPDCCSGVCTNLAADPLHCGDCTIACGAGQLCCSGTCAVCCDATQCDDSDPCTADDCVGGSCSNVAIGDMGACTDGSGICCSGVCQGGGADCCYDSNCAAAGLCTGTPPSCAGRGDSSSCGDVAGCWWNYGGGGHCEGTAVQCSGMFDFCANNCGCSWDGGTGSCSGRGDCSGFDIACALCGCTYVVYCFGSASCGDFSCTGQPGCDWTPVARSCTDFHCTAP